VTWEEFKQFAQLRRSVHKLAVALDFFRTTVGSIGRADFQRAIVKILGTPLPDHLVRPPSCDGRVMLPTLLLLILLALGSCGAACCLSARNSSVCWP
jgi:hypothetical protein